MRLRYIYSVRSPGRIFSFAMLNLQNIHRKRRNMPYAKIIALLRTRSDAHLLVRLSERTENSRAQRWTLDWTLNGKKIDLKGYPVNPLNDSSRARLSKASRTQHFSLAIVDAADVCKFTLAAIVRLFTGEQSRGVAIHEPRRNAFCARIRNVSTSHT